MKWNIKELVNEYAVPEGDDLLFTDDDADMLLVKQIVNDLPKYNKIIILMYAELGSMMALAKELDVSHSAVIKRIDQIKAEVFSKFYEEKARALNNKIKRQLHGDNT